MCPLRRLGRHAVRCATVRNSSFRCCRRAKAASRSRTARSFWKKMATSILACRTHCCTSTPSCKPFPTSPTRCTPWLAEWKSCACTLASFWNRTSAISSSDRNSLLHLYAELQAIPNKPDEVHALARRVEELRVHLGFILESNQRNIVFWIERRTGRGPQHNVFLQATPITVSDILRTTLFEHLESAVLTSATRAVAGGFEYIRTRIGIEHARELVVQSHFDYESQALLYVPPDLPDPREAQFVERASQRVKQLLEITRGRAFCLFTSYALMHQLYERLLGELAFPLLLQGEAPKNALLEEFRLTPNAVLFATSSFWQGVDVQGEQLSCVIIDKLPFAVPNDPVATKRLSPALAAFSEPMMRCPSKLLSQLRLSPSKFVWHQFEREPNFAFLKQKVK